MFLHGTQNQRNNMRVFFASSPSRKHINLLGECGVENLLISYHFIKSPERLISLLENWKPKNLIIDSGAFSVWSNGGSIDIHSYTKFCRDVKNLLPKEISLYVVNLDVLPGKLGERPTPQEVEESASRGWDNMLFLEKEGLKVIHVFHQHEDFRWLEKLMLHSDYIGLSPANDVSMPEKENFLKKCFSITQDKVKCHGFAVTSHTQLYTFPFYSVDSSSWVSPARYGRIPLFTDKLEIKSVIFKNKEHVLKYWNYLKEYGIEKIADVDWKLRTTISIKSFQKLEKAATHIWTQRGIVWD